MLLSVLLASSSLFTLTPGSPTPTAQDTLPVGIRQCYLEAINQKLIAPFASYLSTLPPAEIQLNMGRLQYRHDVNGTCLQVLIYNWSCTHNLTITGPSLANTVTSIAEQCNGGVLHEVVTGPTGFGYYRDIETGHDYTKHLWVDTGGCGEGHRQSACNPGA